MNIKKYRECILIINSTLNIILVNYIKSESKVTCTSKGVGFYKLQTKKIIMKAFITSQLGYCPFIWMCHNRNLQRQIDRIQERALRIVYTDNNSSFEDLLKKSGSVSIHHRNLQHMAIEIYKALNYLSSSLMTELFCVKEEI